MQFNEKLKKLRAQKGVSQAELAKGIFVSRSAVAKWENGLGLPSEESLKALAEYFGVSTSELKSDPIHEEIIIQKNGTVSKLKIVIIILSVLFAIITILSAVFISLGVDKPVVHPGFEPVYIPEGRGLIFETEKDRTQFGDIKNYDDGELGAGKQFAPNRTFILSNNKLEMALPKLVREIAVQETASYKYENVKYDALTFYATQDEAFWIYQSDNNVWAGTSTAVAEFTAYVNIKYGDEHISIKIVKVPTSVQSVNIALSDKSQEIGLTESKYLNIDINPYNATYIDFSYTIEKIERPNGSLYEGDLSQYAEIKQESFCQYILSTTKDIELNSKIYVSATTDVENVKSNILIIEVVRIKIDNISWENWFDYLTAGTSRIIDRRDFSFSPASATANVLNEKPKLTLLTPEIATLETYENGWILTASSEYAAVNEYIKLKVSTPEGYNWVLDVLIEAIPIESMKIYNANTDVELADTTYLTRESTLQFKSVVYPENASIDKVTYHFGSKNTTNPSAYIDISDDGLLTVYNHAPLGMEIWLAITSGGESSKMYKLIIQPRQLEQITISCETDLAVIGETFRFSVFYTPEKFDITSSSVYKLVEPVEGVYISANMIYVSPDATVGSRFQVVVCINGVESNILEFTIVESSQ